MRAKRLALAAALLFSLGLSSGEAAEIGYPQAAPRFTLNVPETWKPVFRGESLTLLPIPEDGFIIQVNQQPSSAEDVLDELTKRVAAEMQFSEIKLGRDSEAENEHGVECTMIISSGKAGPVDVTLTVIAFTLVDETEQHFTIQSAGPAELNQKHKAVLLGLVDSIKPIEQK